jgi:hypothetical protein
MMTQGYTATLAAATLAISRSSLFYRKKPRGSRADRRFDEQIVVASGDKASLRLPASGPVVPAEGKTEGES